MSKCTACGFDEAKPVINAIKRVIESYQETYGKEPETVRVSRTNYKKLHKEINSAWNPEGMFDNRVFGLNIEIVEDISGYFVY